MKNIVYKLEWFLLDAVTIMASYILAFVLLELLGFDKSFGFLSLFFLSIIPFKIIVYYFLGLYKLILKSIGFEDLLKIISLVIVTNVVILAGILLFNLTGQLHPVELFIITLFELGMISVSRVSLRLFNLYTNKTMTGKRGKRVMIVGAGLAGEMVVKELNKNSHAESHPTVFVDDDLGKVGRRLLGLNIEGPTDSIESLIKKYQIDEVIVAIANISLPKLRTLLEKIASTNTPVKRVPTLKEINAGKPYEVKPVKITDLLSRDEITLNNQLIHDFIQGETVLVTGGGGSIGSELVRQIAEMAPKCIIIYDIYENTAYEVQTSLTHEFKRKNIPLDLKVLIGSVYNEARLKHVFEMYKPTLVFHAAAYKHVPLMEDSPVEAIRTNILGTHIVSELCQHYQVKKMILVSSDKAVRPTNIMGATKRMAERIIQTAQKQSDSTVYAAVRFGNVLGSHGSVIPLFKRQIEAGGPVTVTDKEVTRYFMTIPESVSLILEAASYAKDGEIFVLDMGEPIKIIDLAEKMIQLVGLKPYEDIPIEFIGLRDGEKQFEELILDESMPQTHNPNIFIDPKRLELPDHWLKRLSDIDQLTPKEIYDYLLESELNYTPKTRF